VAVRSGAGAERVEGSLIVSECSNVRVLAGLGRLSDDELVRVMDGLGFETDQLPQGYGGASGTGGPAPLSVAVPSADAV
jgi:hypothetical protein